MTPVAVFLLLVESSQVKNNRNDAPHGIRQVDEEQKGHFPVENEARAEGRIQETSRCK